MWASSFSGFYLHRRAVNILGLNHRFTLVADELRFLSDHFDQTTTTIHTERFVRDERQRHGFTLLPCNQFPPKPLSE
jgi:hypothetical protein